MNFLIKKRRIIQFVLGFSIYLIVRFFSIPLGYVILFGGFLGIISGKVFCRWMCPIGYIVESIIKLRNDDEKATLSQYYKLGCP
ncbi:MAG: 4Fe-4S binding protein, partial [Bacillota bacterium]